MEKDDRKKGKSLSWGVGGGQEGPAKKKKYWNVPLGPSGLEKPKAVFRTHLEDQAEDDQENVMRDCLG